MQRKPLPLRGDMTAINLSYRQRIYEGRTARLRNLTPTECAKPAQAPGKLSPEALAVAALLLR